MKNKIVSYLHNIFKSDTLTFTVINTVKSAVLDLVSVGNAVNRNYINSVRFHEVGEIQFPGRYIDKISDAVNAATPETTAVNMALARTAVDAYELEAAHLPMPAMVNSGNKMNTSNDFFMYLNQLLVNHIHNDELLKNFKLIHPANV